MFFPLVLLAVLAPSLATIPTPERRALVDIYTSTYGPWWLRGNIGPQKWDITNNDSDACNWYGVYCDARHTVVQELKLSSNNMSGYLSSAIGNLSSLQVLELSSNSIGGSLPEEVSLLSSLYSLQAYENNIQGTLPCSLSKLIELETLDLSSNQIDGSLCSEFSNLKMLYVLTLTENLLTGTIGDWIGNMTSLRLLSLSSTMIGGGIPSSLASLTNLLMLDLSNATFSGTIPSGLGSLSALTHLSLGSNMLRGSIPNEIFNLRNLTYLYLGDNSDLRGSISPAISNLAKLQVLDLSDTSFSGTIPESIGVLTSLYSLDFGRAFLEGTIPSSFTSLRSLQRLDLSYNKLEGTLPTSFFENMTSLTWLSLSQNCLEGRLDDSICRLSELRTLYLSGMSIVCAQRTQGTLLKRLGITKAVAVKDLLGGKIPQCLFTDLHKLETALLGSIGFKGRLPDILNLTSLIQLDLSYNRLTGTLPSEIMVSQSNTTKLDFSYNYFSGSLDQVSFPLSSDSNTDVFQTLNLTVNRLSCDIPASIPRLFRSVNILFGNIWGCPLPDTLRGRDSHYSGYSCGSRSLDVPLLFSLCMAIVTATAFFILHTKGVLSTLHDTSVIWQKILPTTSLCFRFCALLHRIKSLAIFGFLPFYALLSIIVPILSKTGSNDFKCAAMWSTTMAYSENTPMAALLMSSSVIALIMFELFITTPARYSRHELMEHPTEERARRTWRRVLLFFAAFAVLISVSLLLNYAYINLNNSSSGLSSWSRWVLQVGMSFAKSLLGFQFAPRVSFLLDPPPGDTDIIGPKTPRVFDILVVVMSTVIFSPILVSLFADESCYLRLVYPLDDVSFSYDETVCSSYHFDTTYFNVTCTSQAIMGTSVSFKPPFIYSYACVSSILSNYIPVFMWSYLFGLIFPLSLFIISSIPHRYFPAFIPSPPGILHPETGLPKQGFALINVHYILANLLTHMAMMCSFGLTAPLLGFLIVASLVIQCTLWHYMIGRFLLKSPNTQHDAEGTECVSQQLERTCARVTALSLAPFVLIVGYVVLAISATAAEMVASEHLGDSSKGGWVYAVLVPIGLALILIHRIVRPEWNCVQRMRPSAMKRSPRNLLELHSSNSSPASPISPRSVPTNNPSPTNSPTRTGLTWLGLNDYRELEDDLDPQREVHPVWPWRELK